MKAENTRSNDASGYGSSWGKPHIQYHGERCSPGFSPRPGECLRVGIQPDDFGAWIEALYEDRQVPGAASDLENSVARPDVRLIHQLPVMRLEAKQPLDRIV